MKSMKKKILILPMAGGALRIEIDIYGRSECRLVEREGSLYLGAALIEKLAQNILAHLEGDFAGEGEDVEGERVWPVIILSGEEHGLFLGGEGGKRRLILRDRGGAIIARGELTGRDQETWREELRSQCR